MARTNVDFVHISTKPLEERIGVEKKSQIKDTNERRHARNQPLAEHPDDIHVEEIDALSIRNGLPDWRKFTAMQVVMAKDYLFSNVSIDKLTLFSLRPPEIAIWIRKPYDYFRWFDVRVVPKDKWRLSLDLNESNWIDAMGNEVRLRSGAYQEILDMLDDGRLFQRQRRDLISHVRDLCKACREFHCDDTGVGQCLDSVWQLGLKYNLFVLRFLPIPVFPHVLPNQPTRFLLHLLYSLGQFDTELELLGSTSFQECFVKAGLL